MEVEELGVQGVGGTEQVFPADLTGKEKITDGGEKSKEEEEVEVVSDPPALLTQLPGGGLVETQAGEDDHTPAFDDVLLFSDGTISAHQHTNLGSSVATQSGHQNTNLESQPVPVPESMNGSFEGLADLQPNITEATFTAITLEVTEESNSLLTATATATTTTTEEEQVNTGADTVRETASVDIPVELKQRQEASASEETPVTVSESQQEEQGDKDPLAQTQVQDGSLHAGEACINNSGEVEVEFEALVRRKVLKNFGEDDYLGEVISYDVETKWYKVVYEDGDEEDLEKDELDAVLLPIGSMVVSTLKRPHSGNKLEDAKERKQNKTSTETTRKRKSSVGSNKNGISSTITLAKKKGSQPGGNKGSKSTAKKQHPSSDRTKSKGGKSKDNRGAKKSPSVSKSNDLMPKKTVKRKWMSVNQAQKTPEKDKTSCLDEGKKSSSKKQKGDLGEDKKWLSKRLKVDSSGPQSESEVKLSAPDKGVSVIGMLVRKKFSGKYFNGEVVGYDKKKCYYKVHYEDGDKEDLEWKELEAVLMNNEKRSMPNKKPTVSARKAESTQLKTPISKSTESKGISIKKKGKIQEIERLRK